MDLAGYALPNRHIELTQVQVLIEEEISFNINKG